MKNVNENYCCQSFRLEYSFSRKTKSFIYTVYLVKIKTRNKSFFHVQTMCKGFGAADSRINKSNCTFSITVAMYHLPVTKILTFMQPVLTVIFVRRIHSLPRANESSFHNKARITPQYNQVY